MLSKGINLNVIQEVLPNFIEYCFKNQIKSFSDITQKDFLEFNIWLKSEKKLSKVNFEAVTKESGVSRTGLYGNPKIRDRILKLRTKCRSAPNSDYTVIKKSDKQDYERQIADYRAKVKQLEQDKLNLINQLVELEDLREEVSRLKSRLIEVNKKE